MSITERAAILARTHERLRSGEPIRVFIGDKIITATEIVLTPEYVTTLRLALICSIADQFPLDTHPNCPAFASQIIENNQQEGGAK